MSSGALWTCCCLLLLRSSLVLAKPRGCHPCRPPFSATQLTACSAPAAWGDSARYPQTAQPAGAGRLESACVCRKHASAGTGVVLLGALRSPQQECRPSAAEAACKPAVTCAAGQLGSPYAVKRHRHSHTRCHPPTHPLDSNLPRHARPPVGAAKAWHLRRNTERLGKGC